jgi:hypothetical protein
MCFYITCTVSLPSLSYLYHDIDLIVFLIDAVNSIISNHIFFGFKLLNRGAPHLDFWSVLNNVYINGLLVFFRFFHLSASIHIRVFGIIFVISSPTNLGWVWVGLITSDAENLIDRGARHFDNVHHLLMFHTNMMATWFKNLLASLVRGWLEGFKTWK